MKSGSDVYSLLFKSIGYTTSYRADRRVVAQLMWVRRIPWVIAPARMSRPRRDIPCDDHAKTTMERADCRIAENLHEWVAKDDDEDSTLLVSPAAKEAPALVPPACTS